MRCKNCHYSLANLTEHRCPECGTPFDPNDPKTVVIDDPDRTPDWIVAIIVGSGLIVIVSLMVLMVVFRAYY